MEPLTPLSSLTARRKTPASTAVSGSSTLSPLASFAKQKQDELVLGSPVANTSNNLLAKNGGAATDAAAASSGEKKLSGLASFTKSQQQKHQLQESVNPTPRSSNANSVSTSLGSNASLARDSPLASFAKSLVSASAAANEKPDSAASQPSPGATTAEARPALKRLSSASRPTLLLKGSLQSLTIHNAQDHGVDTGSRAPIESEAKMSSYEERDGIHETTSQEKQTHVSDEAKAHSAAAAAEDSNSFSDMGEANIVRPDEESEGNGDAESDTTLKGASGGEREAKEAKCESLDVQTAEADLYTSSSGRTQPKPLVPKIFVPKASEIPLFHAVVALDEELLEGLLEQLNPDEILLIRDHDERSLYHYAALSPRRSVTARVFSHANRYFDSDLDLKIHDLMAKKQQMHAWMETEQTRSKTWIPPRVKELQRQSRKAKQAALLRICECVDRDDRSIFHYAGTSKAALSIEDKPQLLSVLQSNLGIFSRKDTCGKTPLHYAVENGNSSQLLWFFQLGAGIHLNTTLIEQLLRLNASKTIRDLLLREAEMLDAVNYRIHSEHDSFSDEDDTVAKDDHEATLKSNHGGQSGDVELGISVYLAAKLERDVTSLSGPLLQSPLLKAAMFGNIGAVKLLLAKGADASARDANGWSVLHYCASGASRNHLAVAQLLLQEAPKQVQINTRSAKGRTALHVAANSSTKKSGSSENSTETQAAKTKRDAKRARMAALLCEHKANFDLQDNSGKTALLLAARSDNVHVAKLLLEKNCSPVLFDNTGSSPLHAAASRGHVEMTAFLSRWDASCRFWSGVVDIQGRKPMDVANNEQTRQALTNLWSASYAGEIENVKRLLQLSKKSHRAKKEGSQCGSTQAVSAHDRTFLTQRSALHLAVQGYADVLNSTTTSSSVQQDQGTPAATEKKRLAKLDTSKREASNRFLQVAQLLVTAGAAELSISFLTRDKWGITPLMLAATIKDGIFMEMLLDALEDQEEERKDNGESLAKQDCDANSALHYAYAFGLAQLSNLLEDRMDDTEIANSQGKAPLDVTGYRAKLFPQGLRDYSAQLQRWRDQQQQQ